MIDTNGHDKDATATAVKRLTVTDILEANDIKEEEVYVEEWQGTVKIRGFTKAKQQELRAMATDPKTGQVDSLRLELQIFIHGVVDPQFAPIQATELREKSAGALDMVLQRIMTISGMTREAIKEAEKSDAD
jgi:hypothetical protein